MSSAAVAEPGVLHRIPGRLRVHLPERSGERPREIESRLRQLRGVHGARADSVTGNVLVRFDPAAIDNDAILAVLRGPGAASETSAHVSKRAVEHEAARPAVLREGRVSDAAVGRARVVVPGLDRDPELARRVVESLQSHPEVKATASPLTGRVLVEWNRHTVDLEELLDVIAGAGLPPLPHEDAPAHPLDPEPLLQSAAETIGTAIALGVLATRGMLGIRTPLVRSSVPVVAAGMIGVVQAFPAARNGLRNALGPHAADLVFSAAGILSLTLANSPLGLIIGGAEALLLLTEVRSRRAAWRLYEERLGDAASAEPGAVIRLEPGERTPLAATVIEGFGTATGRDMVPMSIAPGQTVGAGARLHGGPFVLELSGGKAFTPEPRPAPLVEPTYGRYVQSAGLLSIGYAVLTAVLTRSLARGFEALLLVNARPAVIGADAANIQAAARVLRSGVTVVGSRPERHIRLPGLLLIDSPRLLSDGLEVVGAVPLTDSYDARTIRSLAAGVAAAAGSPWGHVFPAVGIAPAANGTFEGRVASADLGEIRYSLEPIDESNGAAARGHPIEQGDYRLLLRRDDLNEQIGILTLRPRLGAGVKHLVETCRRRRVEIALLSRGDAEATQALGRRAEIPVLDNDDVVGLIRARQQAGPHVAYVSDNARAAAAFAACDVGIGVTLAHSRLPARADFLAPDLTAVAAIIEAGAQRDATIRDSVALSAAANVFGAIWGFRGTAGIRRASYAVNVGALCALAVGVARLRGGRRTGSSVSRIVDPHPERWGQRDIASVLRTLATTEHGLTTAEAAKRRRAALPAARQNGLGQAIFDQLRAPLTLVLFAGAGLSLSLGATADVAMIGTMIIANAAAGVWQERRANKAVAALQRMGTVFTPVLRDGTSVMVPATEVVPGDVFLLAPGVHIAADARLLEANGLEVDEAALTGESLPIPKAPDGGDDASRVVLEGSAVVVGSARAVVVAVGRKTRMGAIAAALTLDDTEKQSPLTARLNQLLGQVLPMAAAGGALITGSGVLRRQPFLPQLAIGASAAIAAVPEGLPLLARIGEAAVARRLVNHRALVRRLSAVEALGRVDVACTDKTGTLTGGRLTLRVVADVDCEIGFPEMIDSEEAAKWCHLLLTAALAGPHPDALDAAANLTDVVVADAAARAGLGEAIRGKRTAESPFGAARSFHNSLVGERICAEGAAEALIPRCDRVRRGNDEHPLDEAGREQLQAAATRLAERGLRVLMVAEGAADGSVDDPQGLVALGFLGISDPLRGAVREAVGRCHDAGVRVMILTGDHPATAVAIAVEAGLPAGDGQVLTGADIADLPDDILDQRLEHATVIARATPLDKLRIVESLQRRGHTVAMTGDGVNDAPALRLADVGIAMGRGGTEVARQAADVVLADDDFSTLVETLVEGRGFWRNIRRALGLLLGGNLGELGLEVGASVLGLAAPLTTRQILAVNLITDVFPALAVALQKPPHRDLATLSREGASALDAPLRREVLRRGTATALPSLAAYLISLRSSSLPQARTVAFFGIIVTQLVQTMKVGRSEEGWSRSVVGAVAGSSAMLAATLALAPLRNFLGLAVPTPFGWILVAGGALLPSVAQLRLSSGTGDEGRKQLSG
ncbi:MAG: HAD-IC family P-type ATPase [Chthoniobacterales bacterium]